jgi:hypothetical protein
MWTSVAKFPHKKAELPKEPFGSSAVFAEKTRRFLSLLRRRFSFVVWLGAVFTLLLQNITSQCCVKLHPSTIDKKSCLKNRSTGIDQSRLHAKDGSRSLLSKMVTISDAMVPVRIMSLATGFTRAPLPTEGSAVNASSFVSSFALTAGEGELTFSL